MKKAYLYPIYSIAGQDFLSAYIENFMNYLSGDFHFMNRTRPSNKGILDIVGYIRDIECVFLNWIEDLPDKRGGLIQSLFFFVIVYFLKLRKVTIIWVMHNKVSHFESNTWLKRILFAFILRKSDYIITHATEGLRCFEKYNIKNNGKIRYFPHPLNKDFIKIKENQTTDILIWGSIIPYKGIDKFLSFLHEKNLQNKYKIRLVGKVKPSGYESVIKGFCNDNIILDNRFVPVEELKKIMTDSIAVVFTYVGDSVLSSGALMDSLSYGLSVLAPHVGAFRDAGELGLISTFQNYDELIIMLDRSLKAPRENIRPVIEQFIDEHNWNQFSLKINDWIN